jgi:hypothetical protein
LKHGDIAFFHKVNEGISKGYLPKEYTMKIVNEQGKNTILNNLREGYPVDLKPEEIVKLGITDTELNESYKRGKISHAERVLGNYRESAASQVELRKELLKTLRGFVSEGVLPEEKLNAAIKEVEYGKPKSNDHRTIFSYIS